MCFLKKLKKRLVLLCMLACIVFTGCNNAKNVADDTYVPEDPVTLEPEVTKDVEDNDKLDDVMLYLPDAEAEYLVAKKEKACKTPEGLVQALVERGALPKGTEVNYFVLKDNDQYITLDDEVASMSDNLFAELDLSDAFLEAIQQTGTASESMLMGAVVNTFCENLNLKCIIVSANGGVIETGHCIYDEPQAFYDGLVE